jgi:hypothetical protein
MRLTPQEQAVLRAAVERIVDGTTRPQRLACDIGCYEMP